MAQSPELGLSFYAFIQFLQAYGLTGRNNSFYIIHKSQVFMEDSSIIGCDIAH